VTAAKLFVLLVLGATSAARVCSRRRITHRAAIKWPCPQRSPRHLHIDTVPRAPCLNKSPLLLLCCRGAAALLVAAQS